MGVRQVCIALLATGLILQGEGVLHAQESTPNPPPSVFAEVLACQQVEVPEQRLACFDASVSNLEKAQATNEVVIADREQIQEAKRGLFGFTLPSLRLFSRGEADEISEIESTISRLSRDTRGKWQFVLEDGARWAQTDTRHVRPKVGDRIKIRQAAMGSYLANINGATAIRVKRSD